MSPLHSLIGVHVAEEKRMLIRLDCSITPVGSSLFFVQNKKSCSEIVSLSAGSSQPYTGGLYLYTEPFGRNHTVKE